MSPLISKPLSGGENLPFLWRGSRFRFAALAKRAEGVSSVRSRCSHVWYSYTTVPGYHLRITLIWTGRPTFSCAAVPNFLNPQTNSPMLGVQLRT